MTDSRPPGSAHESPEDSTAESSHDTRPAHGSGPRRPRKVYLPWWVLTALGALVGFATASWPGLVVGGALGFFAWKLK